MHKTFLFWMIFSSVWVMAQTEEEIISHIKEFRQELNDHYKDKETSPLKKKERRQFKGHQFYDIDLSYRVKAQVDLIDKPDTVIMPTSAGTEKTFVRYAALKFNIADKAYQLIGYRRVYKGELQNYLFIPFRDETSGNETYGGGRYIDLDVPTENNVILDFNLAYNPYCAYTTGWFCPLPPEENTLEVAIKAGLKNPKDH